MNECVSILEVIWVGVFSVIVGYMWRIFQENTKKGENKK